MSNTKRILADVPESLYKRFKRKLITQGDSMIDVISAFAEYYISTGKKPKIGEDL